ncbi:MAG: hypothetical protein RR357_03985 [Clostridia bacterium]
MNKSDNQDGEFSHNLTDEVPISVANGNASEVTVKSIKSKNDKVDKPKKSGLKSHWAIKATVITFFLSAFFSFIAQMTSTAGNIIVTILLLLFLISGSILFDGIGVAVASCELAPLTAMASKKVHGSKTAIRLVKNAEVVANICNDVIGDIFGILSGACTVVIVSKIVINAENQIVQLVTICVSAVVSALIVGGKAFLKNYAINKSKEFVMLTARVISVFTKENKKRGRKKN